MEYLIMGIAAAFNLLIVYWKVSHNRVGDGVLDAIALVILSSIFGGTLGGMLVATVASAIVSLVLLINPPKLKGKANA